MKKGDTMLVNKKSPLFSWIIHEGNSESQTQPKKKGS